MIISERLRHIANMVTEGNRLADIGTDHGFVPITLIQEGRIPSAVAMDINEGPLERAAFHVKEAGLEDRISLRLSDGLEAIRPGEADTVLIAGMGGALTVRILKEGLKYPGHFCSEESASADKSDRNATETDADPDGQESGMRSSNVSGITELVLQPQSETAKVRTFLEQNNWTIDDEDMVLEDGKFYQMIKCRQGCMKLTEEEAAFGPVLIGKKHPVLKEYLLWQEGVYIKILESLRDAGTSGARNRIPEIERQMGCLRRVLSGWN